MVTAIASDFDLGDGSQAGQLCDTLDTLKLTALEQEDLPFDPTGTSGLNMPNGIGTDGIATRSASRNDTVHSRETDITSITSEFSTLSIDRRPSNGHGQSNSSGHASSESIGYIIGADGSPVLVGASEDDKASYLAEMFPSIDPLSTRHTLKKAGGDVERSMDVLLNLAFFDEKLPDEDGTTVCIPKGVDGFAGFDDMAIGRKKGRKRKGKNKCNTSQDSSPYVSDEAPTVNKWNAGREDVDFIHSRVSASLKKETVASAYHSNGASLSSTIQSLARSHAPTQHSINEDPLMIAQVAELAQVFSTVPSTMLAGLLCLTGNSVPPANELAAAMMKRPTHPPISELIKFTTSRPPIDLDDEEDYPRTPSTRVARDYNRARSSAGRHLVASAEAFSKASAAYRRGRSDRMMGGAAAYYSSVGRENLEQARHNAAAAADALVDSQSQATVLDLHGVSVTDAVRIARERVAAWWESIGEARFMRGPRRFSYQIVTGVGRHSHDGTSRLGPAVTKMLAREGWKVEVGDGMLTVTGVARR